VQGFGHGAAGGPGQAAQPAQRDCGYTGRVGLHGVSSSFVLLRLSLAAG
jgi:hypothetical protein